MCVQDMLIFFLLTLMAAAAAAPIDMSMTDKGGGQIHQAELTALQQEQKKRLHTAHASVLVI